MKRLRFEGEHIRLRALEPEDVDTLFKWQNDSELLSSSLSFQPVSRKSLEDYITNESHKSLFETGQIYLLITLKETGQPVGTIDFYDFDPFQKRLTVGILIDEDHRRKGYASEALNLMCDYALEHLKLYQVVATVIASNIPSRRLFESAGFESVAVLPKWQWSDGEYRDLAVYRKSAY